MFFWLCNLNWCQFCLIKVWWKPNSAKYLGLKPNSGDWEEDELIQYGFLLSVLTLASNWPLPLHLHFALSTPLSRLWHCFLHTHGRFPAKLPWMIKLGNKYKINSQWIGSCFNNKLSTSGTVYFNIMPVEGVLYSACYGSVCFPNNQKITPVSGYLTKSPKLAGQHMAMRLYTA